MKEGNAISGQAGDAPRRLRARPSGVQRRLRDRAARSTARPPPAHLTPWSLLRPPDRPTAQAGHRCAWPPRARGASFHITRSHQSESPRFQGIATVTARSAAAPSAVLASTREMLRRRMIRSCVSGPGRGLEPSAIGTSASFRSQARATPGVPQIGEPLSPRGSTSPARTKVAGIGTAEAGVNELMRAGRAPGSGMDRLHQPGGATRRASCG